MEEPLAAQLHAPTPKVGLRLTRKKVGVKRNESYTSHGQLTPSFQIPYLVETLRRRSCSFSS
jgi:hypothetical protein